jgi:hypothetical protein
MQFVFSKDYGLEFLAAVAVKISIFWDVAAYTWVKFNWLSGGMYRLNF